MSEEEKVERLQDDSLEEVAGGMTRNMAAAYDVMAGKYGVGDDRRYRLQAAGYDYWAVQRLVNGLCYNYDKVARDVIDGRYGVGEARMNALRAAGYDAQLVQDIVNGMLLS